MVYIHMYTSTLCAWWNEPHRHADSRADGGHLRAVVAMGVAGGAGAALLWVQGVAVAVRIAVSRHHEDA